MQPDSNDRDTLVEVTEFADQVVPLNPVGRTPIGHLLILMMKTNRKMNLFFMFDQSRFSESTIRLMAQDLHAILSQIIDDSGKKIVEIELTPELRDRFEDASAD